MIARKIETLYIRAPDAEDPRGPLLWQGVRRSEKRSSERNEPMIRKTSLVLLGAIAGSALVLLATQPTAVIGFAARAATSIAAAPGAETYRQLQLFGDV